MLICEFDFNKLTKKLSRPRKFLRGRQAFFTRLPLARTNEAFHSTAQCAVRAEARRVRAYVPRERCPNTVLFLTPCEKAVEQCETEGIVLMVTLTPLSH